MANPLDDMLGRWTDELTDSYALHEATQRIGDAFLPSRSEIVEIIHEIRQLLFPGFFGHKQLTKKSLRFHVGSLLTHVAASLAEQINHCICMDGGCNPQCEEHNECFEQARQLTGAFLSRLPALREILADDVEAAYDGDPAAKRRSEVIYCYPGFFAVTVYRIAHELYVLDVPLMPRIMTEYAHGITGADIHPAAKIGRRFFIDHATGVVIGETVEIGDNVKIYQGVTLGAKSFPKDERGRVIKGLRRHPRIEDNVVIYPNATILGGETVIGESSTVGGNTYITHSVEARHLVLQEDPKLQVIRKR